MKIEPIFQPSNISKFELRNEGKVRRNDAVEDAVCSNEEYANPGNFAMIAKISLGLRKYRNHSENFAILAKLRNFARLSNFANHCA